MHDTQPPLRNLMTKTVIDKDFQQKIPNVLKTREKRYLLFTNEQYIKRSKILTAI